MNDPNRPMNRMWAFQEAARKLFAEHGLDQYLSPGMKGLLDQSLIPIELVLNDDQLNSICREDFDRMMTERVIAVDSHDDTLN